MEKQTERNVVGAFGKLEIIGRAGVEFRQEEREREWPKKRITAEWKQLEGEGGGSRGWKAQGGTQSVGSALLCLAALLCSALLCLALPREERGRSRSIDASLPPRFKASSA